MMDAAVDSPPTGLFPMTVPTSITSIPGVALRPARREDLAPVERLLSALNLPLVGLLDALPDFIVAEADGVIVGVAGLEQCGSHALLRSVAVSDAWRSRGLGSALVLRILADADARGIPVLYLLTTTAERYFPSFGFREIARDEVPDDVRATAEFRSACPASAIVMMRPGAAVDRGPGAGGRIG
jgi:N-acetylglutamate synthase-like GNAT family acetyltransferase